MPAEPSPAAVAPSRAAAAPSVARVRWGRLARIGMRLTLLLTAFTIYDAIDGDGAADLLKTIIPGVIAAGLWWFARGRRDRAWPRPNEARKLGPSGQEGRGYGSAK